MAVCPQTGPMPVECLQMIVFLAMSEIGVWYLCSCSLLGRKQFWEHGSQGAEHSAHKYWADAQHEDVGRHA